MDLIYRTAMSLQRFLKKVVVDMWTNFPLKKGETSQRQGVDKLLKKQGLFQQLTHTLLTFCPHTHNQQ